MRMSETYPTKTTFHVSTVNCFVTNVTSSRNNDRKYNQEKSASPFQHWSTWNMTENPHQNSWLAGNRFPICRLKHHYTTIAFGTVVQNPKNCLISFPQWSERVLISEFGKMWKFFLKTSRFWLTVMKWGNFSVFEPLCIAASRASSTHSKPT